MLDRDAAMRVLMRDGRDDPGLLVAPFDGADAGGLAQWRGLAGRADDEPGAQPPPVPEQGDGARLARLHRRDGLRRQQFEARQGRSTRQQGSAQYSVLDDVAERRSVVG